MADGQETVYDAAILGTGPAGISAAITLKIRNKNILLFGTRDLSNKLGKAHEINNYPGFPAASGEDLRNSFLKHLDSLGIEITQEQITACYQMGKYYSLLSKTNKTYNAKTIIVASGVNFGKPYEGEENFLGRGVSYCATCDAPLYRNKTVAILGQSAKEESEAAFMTEVCSKVYYIPLYKEQTSFESNGNTFGGKLEIIHDVPVRIEGTMKANTLVMKNSTLNADGFFILRDSVSPKQLVPGLELDGNHIAVNRKMETNLKGCFACGDITGLPYQYVKAAGEGNVAALSAVQFLAKTE